MEHRRGLQGVRRFAGKRVFTPHSISGLVAWYRADLGITIATGVSAWADQSGTGDANKNAAQATGAAQPTLTAADANLGGKPSLAFNGSQFMKTGTWASPLAEPFTVLLVGYTSVAASPNSLIALDGIDGTNLVEIYADATSASDVAVYSGGAAPVDSAVVSTTPFSMVAVFNGASTSLYVNRSSAPVTGNPGSNGIAGLTIGERWAAAGGTAPWNGAIAEIAYWSGAMSASNVVKVQAYAGSRYGITITP